MPNLDTTGSFVEVDEHNVGGVRDRFVRLGSGIIVRQFDTQSVIPPGSWSEIWVGMRFRFTCSYSQYSGSNVYPLNEEIPGFEWGLCDTSLPVYGQSGSLSQSPHSIGVSTGDWSLVAGLSWDQTDTGSHTYLSRGLTTVLRNTGSLKYLYPGGNVELSSFVNSLIDSSSLRSTNILRFVTGSNATTMSMYMMWRNNYSSTNYNDISSSSQLASLMTASTWTQLITAGSSLGYSNSLLSTHTDLTLHSIIDGVYFSWYRLFDCIDISDVVLRRIP